MGISECQHKQKVKMKSDPLRRSINPKTTCGHSKKSTYQCAVERFCVSIVVHKKKQQPFRWCCTQTSKVLAVIVEKKHYFLELGWWFPIRELRQSILTKLCFSAHILLQLTQYSNAFFKQFPDNSSWVYSFNRTGYREIFYVEGNELVEQGRRDGDVVKNLIRSYLCTGFSDYVPKS